MTERERYLMNIAPDFNDIYLIERRRVQFDIQPDEKGFFNDFFYYKHFQTAQPTITIPAKRGIFWVKTKVTFDGTLFELDSKIKPDAVVTRFGDYYVIIINTDQQERVVSIQNGFAVEITGEVF